MELKRGYIEVFYDGSAGFLTNSHGFCFDDLESINSQIQELEEFENVKEGVYVFRPQYCTAEKDHMGRITAPGYWEFEEDEYTEKANEQIKKEFDEYQQENKGVDASD